MTQNDVTPISAMPSAVSPGPDWLVPAIAFDSTTGIWRPYKISLAQLAVAAADGSPLVVVDGDSTSDVVAATGIWTTLIPSICMLFARSIIINFAHHGDTIADLIARYPGQAGALNPAAFNESYYIPYIGLNDTVSVGKTADTMNADITTLTGMAKASGYKKITCFALDTRGDGTVAQDLTRRNYNYKLRFDPSRYDYLVPLDTVFLDPSATETYIIGGGPIHKTPAGDRKVAQAVADTMLGSGLSPAIAVDPFAYGGMQLNAACDISQRNGTTAVGLNGYPVDQAQLKFNTIAATAQQSSDGPAGISNSISIAVTGAVGPLGASDFLFLDMPIEAHRVAGLNLGLRSARPFSIGFWTKHLQTGLFGGAILNAAADRSLAFSYTQVQPNVWEYKEILAIPGCGDGTWAAVGRGLTLRLAFAAGSTFIGAPGGWLNTNLVGPTGMVNGASSIANTFKCTIPAIFPGVLTPGSQQLSSILRRKHQELPELQRYCCSDFADGVVPGDNLQSRRYNAAAHIANSVFSQRLLFPRRMFDVPTVTLFGSNVIAPTPAQWQYFSGGTTWLNMTGCSVTNSDRDGFLVTGSGVMTIANSYIVTGSWLASSPL